MSGTNKRRSSHFKRRRRRGSYLGVTGKFPTRLNKFSLFYESLRERDLFVLLAYQCNVVSVEDHPFSIEHRIGGRLRRYTPDALIRYAKGPDDVVEVKTTGELEKKLQEYELIFKSAKQDLQAKGQQFRVITEEDLPRPMVRSLRFLLPYRLYPQDEALEKRILAAVKSTVRLRDLCRSLVKKGVEEGDIVAQTWRLVSLQRIHVDLDHPLSMDSQLEGRSWTTKL